MNYFRGLTSVIVRISADFQVLIQGDTVVEHAHEPQKKTTN